MPFAPLENAPIRPVFEASPPALPAPASAPEALPAPLPAATSTPDPAAAPPPVSAALDEATLADREAARAELASRFQIVEEGHAGERAPNQVTEAEFEEVAAEFSDIRMGKTGLKLDTGPEPWPGVGGPLPPRLAEWFKAGTMGDIASIMQTESGRELVHALASQDPEHSTTIRLSGGTHPWMGAETLNGPSPDVSYVPGARLEFPSDDPSTMDYPSDVALMHELSHALHGVQGSIDRTHATAEEGPPSQDVGVSNEEEHAVGLGKYAGERLSENSYRAERALIGASGAGAQPGDEGMPQRHHYHNTPAAGVTHATGDPALAEAVVLAGIPAQGPPQPPQQMAEEARYRELAPEALEAAARRELGDEYAAQLEAAIEARKTPPPRPASAPPELSSGHGG